MGNRSSIRGRLALGSLAFSSKLADATGAPFSGITGAHTQGGITALATFLGILMNEAPSTTASANMGIPVMIAIAGST